MVYFSATHTSSTTASTGIQRVTRHLGEVLQHKTDVTFLRWDRTWNFFRRLTVKEEIKLTGQDGPSFPTLTPFQGFKHDLWVQFPYTSFSSEDVLFFPELVTPERLKKMLQCAHRHQLRTVALFYDDIPLRHPEWVNHEIRHHHEGYMRLLCEMDLVLAISDWSAQGLRDFACKHYLKSSHIITCTLPGEFKTGRRFSQPSPPSSQNFQVLYVATLEPRKNHLLLLEAWRLACAQIKQSAELILVGNEYSQSPDIVLHIQNAQKTGEAVRWLGGIDDQDLQPLYENCYFTIYASRMEGFGLPIMESLWQGKPCLCSDQGVMAELAVGGGCLTTDMTNAEAIANAIVSLFQSQELHQRLSLEARNRKFKTWQEYGDEVLSFLSPKP